MSTEKTYRGWIQLHDHSEAMDVLFLVERDWSREMLPTPLCEIIQDDIAEHGHFLSVRYFTSDTERSPDEVLDSIIMMASGLGEAVYFDHYSEITGYLWTDEDFTVGGHDLHAELASHGGQFLHMTIAYHSEAQS